VDISRRNLICQPNFTSFFLTTEILKLPSASTSPVTTQEFKRPAKLVGAELEVVKSSLLIANVEYLAPSLL